MLHETVAPRPDDVYMNIIWMALVVDSELRGLTMHVDST